MQIFKIDDTTSVVCNASNTRNGFKHEASLMVNGREVLRKKINYLNRTWERYTYESVLHALLESSELYSADEVQEIVNRFSK